MPAAHEPRINAVQAAQHLNRSKAWVYSQVQHHALPHYRVGGRIEFLRSDLDAWLESCHVPAGGPEPAPARERKPRVKPEPGAAISQSPQAKSQMLLFRNISSYRKFWLDRVDFDSISGNIGLSR